jgi:FkbM family methyltransferase
MGGAEVKTNGVMADLNRAADFNRIMPCRHGMMVFNVNDQFVGKSLELYGEFSEGEAELFARILRAGDLVVEVGANIGAHTVQLAKLVTGNGGRVYAIEPQRLAFQLLCGNIAINSLDNVWTLQAAMGTGEGTVRVPELDPRSFQNFGGLSLPKQSVGEEVPVIALDELGLPRCRMIKIDVEGMEPEVLQGAGQTIGRCRPWLYVECDRRDKAAGLLAHLLVLKYRVLWHAPPLYNANNLRRNPQNIYPNVVSANVLCVPEEQEGGTVTAGLCDVRDPSGIPMLDEMSSSVRR